ncbi:MAG: hypothetical protein JWN04_3822 [Myxococcaceae bacterium]|nr:hypothetical protein [Myxococcaceae bacterium]
MPWRYDNTLRLSYFTDSPWVSRRLLATKPWLERHAITIASILWIVTFVVPAALIVAGRMRAIPFREYMGAGRRWWQHEPLYDLGNIDGFQYLPQAAILFSPLAWLGSPTSDVLFRALGWSLYAFGLWRFVRILVPERAPFAFLLASALATGPAFGNLINGQANLLVGALLLHAGVELIERRWWRASLILTVGLALKPLMAVPVLLIGVVYRPMTLRLPLLVALMLFTPWLLREASYVSDQYEACLLKLRLCADPDRLFEDVRGLLVTLGLGLSVSVYLALRAGAALGVLAMGLWARVRVLEPAATLLVSALAAGYLMLFNPRTLSSSYVMTGGFAALLGAKYVLERRHSAALLMLALCLAWTINHHVLPWIEFWLRPLACIAFFIVLARELFVPQRVTSRS